MVFFSISFPSCSISFHLVPKLYLGMPNPREVALRFPSSLSGPLSRCASLRSRHPPRPEDFSGSLAPGRGFHTSFPSRTWNAPTNAISYFASACLSALLTPAIRSHPLRGVGPLGPVLTSSAVTFARGRLPWELGAGRSGCEVELRAVGLGSQVQLGNQVGKVFARWPVSIPAR